MSAAGQIIFKDNPNARAESLPPDRPRRKPLGLRPAIDDATDKAVASRAPAPDDEPAPGCALDGPPRSTPVDHGTLCDYISIATDMVALDGINPLKAKIAETRSEIARLELENAQQKATIAELRAKTNELSFIVERLRVESKGPPGAAGPRGRDGRDGVPPRRA